jgi:hypothetical protein
MSQPAPSPDVHPTAGPEWAAFVREQLEEERNRKESLERRGISVVTTSSFLLTVLLGLSSLVLARNDTLGDSAIAWMTAALVLFLIAVILGALTNWVRSYEEVKVSELQEHFQEGSTIWKATAETGFRRTTTARINVLADARKKNDFKAWLLKGALLNQVVAAGSVAVAVNLVLRGF